MAHYQYPLVSHGTFMDDDHPRMINHKIIPIKSHYFLIHLLVDLSTSSASTVVQSYLYLNQFWKSHHFPPLVWNPLFLPFYSLWEMESRVRVTNISGLRAFSEFFQFSIFAKEGFRLRLVLIFTLKFTFHISHPCQRNGLKIYLPCSLLLYY